MLQTIWDEYTPARVFAFYAAAQQNRRQEMAENLIVAAIGANGSKDSIEKQLEEWRDGD